MSEFVVCYTFANHEEPHLYLPGLREEFDVVNAYVKNRERLRKPEFRREEQPFCTRKAIADLLSEREIRDLLIVFSYSGHATGDKLITEDEETASNGLAGLLGSCPQLQVILLNGCGTQGQLDKILEEYQKQGNNPPTIIATSAPIGDKTAAAFGMEFFRQIMYEDAPVCEAFEIALKVTRMDPNTNISTEDARGIGLGGGLTGRPIWGMFGNKENKWKLSDLTPPSPGSFIANQLLFEGLILSLVDHNARIREDSENNGGQIVDFDQHIEEVLKSFPYPISVQLRKLRAVPGREEPEGSVFYNKPSSYRLEQLIRTYQTTVDILTAIAHAEWWNVLDNKVAEKSLSKEEFAQLTRIADFPRHSQLILLATFIRKYVTENRTVLVQEFVDPRHLFDSNGNIDDVGKYFESLKKDLPKLPQVKIGWYCEMAERQLTELLTSCAFLVNYRLVSVKNISILKNRLDKVPRYHHKVYQYWGSYLEPTLRSQYSQEVFMENAVLLQNKDEPSKEYLNLSPLLIDINSYDDKSFLSNLYVWNLPTNTGDIVNIYSLENFDKVRLALRDVKQVAQEAADVTRNRLIYGDLRKLWAQFNAALLSKSNL